MVSQGTDNLPHRVYLYAATDRLAVIPDEIRHRVDDNATNPSCQSYNGLSSLT